MELKKYYVNRLAKALIANDKKEILLCINIIKMLNNNE